ncbi:MAG: DUF2807 domain-containing protein [Alistipes senegalensis]|nr:DUF2807 domain-containing protein [Bacteroides cellulosilyticus]MCM1352243.1 DUF2807 domain-containing protein [Alistipes senegalensis]
MKKLISSLIAALLFVCTSWAQTTESTPAEASASAKSEWLTTFSSVQITAPLDIVFIRIPAYEAPKIVYDTKGSYTTKFRFEVKNHVLRISEREDERRPGRTEVTVYYNTLESLSVTDATALFREPIVGDLFDLTLGTRAALTATLDVKDLKMEVSGRCTATLDGTARYLTLSAATGTIDALDLEVLSARVNATTGSSVTLNVTERLEAVTATNGSVHYKTEPPIMRNEIRLMGGAIEQVK